jgi:serine/threonine-protein kinase
MTPDPAAQLAGHARVKQLFNAVCDLPNATAQRQAMQALGADGDTQAEVLRLLTPTGGTTRFSNSVAQTAVQWLGSELRPGDRLGAWTLLQPLGSGGMGRVYLAERSDGHYQQQAAIKLLLGWSGAQALARLTSERQILARLNHPHIAKLLDGGTTPAGQPYLVMEYADGDTIDVWCQRQGASLEARLALFGSVCEAVAQAHRHLVIHCDIKPANVLVNAEGRAMLVDFGIALLEGQGNDAAVGMTAGYASPEQAAGLAPGPPSDIFSLGRLLDDLVRPVAVGHRRIELAAIVARATAADAAQRYDSAAALQRDLQRLLSQRPVAAMGGGTYRLRKGLRRHWPWVLAGALGLAGMSVVTARLAWQLDRAETAERQALRAEAQALGVAAQARLAEQDALQQLGAARNAAAQGAQR